jgi:hypothetical protein
MSPKEETAVAAVMTARAAGLTFLFEGSTVSARDAAMAMENAAKYLREFIRANRRATAN